MNKNLLNWFCVCVATIAFTNAGCSDPDPNRDPVSLYAASSTMDVISEIAKRFDQTEEIQVRTNFAGSSTLALQIINGADADLFFSADRDWIEELQSVKPGIHFQKILENKLVLVGSTGLQSRTWYPSQIREILDARVNRIAIGDPASVPAGKYAKMALQNLELWESVRDKLSYSADVRQVLAQIETGAVDYGIVYQTDAQISNKVVVLSSIAHETTGPINYYLALTESGQLDPRAKQLYDYLFAQESGKIFERFGFIPIEIEQE